MLLVTFCLWFVAEFATRGMSFTSVGKLFSPSLIVGGKGILQPLQFRCTHTQLSRDLATKCRRSTKILQTTNRKSPTAWLSYTVYRTQSTLVAIRTEMTSRHTECILLKSDYSQMPAAALHKHPKTVGGRESKLLTAGVT